VNRIFVFHFSLGFLIGCFVLIHIIYLHSFSSSNPFINNSSFIIPFYAIFYKDCLFSCFFVFYIIFYLFLEPDILGNCDNLVFANPLSTPNHILPE